MPDTLPKWAITGVRWILIGLAVGYFYADLSRDIADFKRSFTGIQIELAKINTSISPLDVDRFEAARLAADVKVLQAGFLELKLGAVEQQTAARATQAEVRSLLDWRERAILAWDKVIAPKPLAPAGAGPQ